MDKESFAIMSEKDTSVEEDYPMGSVHSQEDCHGIRVHELCEVLLKPSMKRS